MAKKKKKKSGDKKKGITIKSNETKLTFGVLVTIAAVALILSPFIEATVFEFTIFQLGYSAIPWGIALLYFGFRFIFNSDFFKSFKIQIGLILFAITTSVFLTFWIPKEIYIDTIIPPDFSDAGGQIGYKLHSYLDKSIGRLLEFIIIILFYTVSFSFISGVKLEQIRDFIVKIFSSFGRLFKKKQPDGLAQDSDFAPPLLDEEPENQQIPQREEPVITQAEVDQKTFDDVVNQEPDFTSPTEKPKEKNKTEKDSDDEEEKIKTEPKYPDWKYPPISLLQDPVIQPQNKEILKKNAKVIEETLKSFGVESKVTNITIGPTVVQFALKITVGTKVAKIRNLANDLALALAAPASSIRIEAPIPGTSLVGIEIPNPTPNFVFEKELVAQLESNIDKFELPLILGKSVSGKHIIQDLTQLPHVLVAGATGTGKSVGINAMIIGLLMTKSPDQVKFILVDPKMVEMSPYNGIPHLLTPVITDMELVVNALQWAIEEMLRRYRMLKQLGVRKIAEYNKKMGFDAMPYVVIIIDEMADLMLSTGVDVESKIVRLAQMSRAVGIHLILATQRPSVDVITGLIKANVPGRVSFSVTTAIDSRVIIDQTGAETLIGKGDMLFKSPELPKPVRVQGAYTDIKDLEKVIDFINNQVEEDIEYKKEVIETVPEEKKSDGNGDEERDELFEDAVDAIIEAGKASASYLQRKLRVGYNRAARIMDQLEEAGAIGPQEGSSARDLLISSKSQIMGSNNSDESQEDEEDFLPSNV
ncbi:cell division protein FtsK [Candidatus Dojkabacteria bacterium]|nr:cell division protein FtsK [Candidatus Dojkabacteria bacterium]